MAALIPALIKFFMSRRGGGGAGKPPLSPDEIAEKGWSTYFGKGTYLDNSAPKIPSMTDSFNSPIQNLYDQLK
jgi:hypothetical protein